MTPGQFKAHLYNVNMRDSRIHEEALLREHAEQQAEIEAFEKCEVTYHDTIHKQEQEIERLREALSNLLKENEDYIKINNLSAMGNINLVRAREALGKEHP